MAIDDPPVKPASRGAGGIRSYRMSRGWAIIWAAFFTTAFVTGGSQYGFGVFVKPLQDEFGWSRTAINLSLSIGLLAGLTAPFVGWFVDKYGSRLIMTVSLLAVGASFLLRMGMTELWQWYALSALLAIGMPGTMTPIGKLVGAWFPRRRGRMMGTAITGNNVFGLIGVPLLNLVIESQGWRTAYGIIGGGVMVVAVAVWLIVRSEPRPDEVERPKPEEMAKPVDDVNYSLRETLHTRLFWLLLGAVLCAGFSYPSFMTQLIPHMEAEGWTSSKASLVLTVLSGTALASKITWGWLSEKLTARISFVIAISIMATGVALVIMAGSTELVWPAVIFFGSGFGGIGPLMQLVMLESFGLRSFGSIQGVTTLALSTVPVLIGPIIAGRLFDATGSYVTSFWIASAIFATGGALAFIARAPGSPEVAEG